MIGATMLSGLAHGLGNAQSQQPLAPHEQPVSTQTGQPSVSGQPTQQTPNPLGILQQFMGGNAPQQPCPPGQNCSGVPQQGNPLGNIFEALAGNVSPGKQSGPPGQTPFPNNAGNNNVMQTLMQRLSAQPAQGTAQSTQQTVGQSQNVDPMDFLKKLMPQSQQANQCPPGQTCPPQPAQANPLDALTKMFQPQPAGGNGQNQTGTAPSQPVQNGTDMLQQLMQGLTSQSQQGPAPVQPQPGTHQAQPSQPQGFDLNKLRSMFQQHAGSNPEPHATGATQQPVSQAQAGGFDLSKLMGMFQGSNPGSNATTQPTIDINVGSAPVAQPGNPGTPPSPNAAKNFQELAENLMKMNNSQASVFQKAQAGYQVAKNPKAQKVVQNPLAQQVVQKMVMPQPTSKAAAKGS
jgi:hypothetical protein